MHDIQFRRLVWAGIACAALGIFVQAAILTWAQVKVQFCPEPHWHLCNDTELKDRVASYLQCIERTTLATIDSKMAFLARDPHVTLLDMLWDMGQVYHC
jgi:hypothetical protein